MNEWSDHVPVSFVLKGHSGIADENTSNFVSYTWNNDLRDVFRTGLIGKLPEFNSISETLDGSSRQSINYAVDNFTRLFREAADPLFRKVRPNYKHVGFSSTFCKTAKWFDTECKNAKLVYRQALRDFNNCRSDENRYNLCDEKKTYKTFIKKKKNLYVDSKRKEIENMRHSKPRDFWKLFKRKNSHSQNKILLEDFRDHFSSIADDLHSANNIDADTFCHSHDFHNIDCNLTELDVPITEKEVRSAISKLKKYKSCGYDSLLNKYFMESVDILSLHMCDIFNAVLDSGYFPDVWSNGVIIPLFKKGNKEDVNNYRGITLVSCFSKIFTSILNRRISDFCERNNVLSDAQFGFREGRSTVDALHLLLSITQRYLNENKRLYCVFVDMKKAFDSVDRNSLWFKLYRSGIQGKMLRVIRDMYSKVKSCVKSCNTYSDFFNYSVGLRQG